MRVIIPAAGEGQRFKKEGYTEPKPLIPICGKPMIQYVLEMVSMIDPCPIVICNYRLREALREMNTLPVSIAYQQQGAALSVLCANGQLDDGEPVMVVDCDNVVEREHFETFTKYCDQRAYDGAGAVLTARLPFGDQSTAWSFVHGVGGRVLHVKEKHRISDLVTIGCNMFPSWRKLREAICRMVANGERFNNEYYLAPCFNHLEAEVGYIEVPLTAWNTFGTPETLKQFAAKRRQVI